MQLDWLLDMILPLVRTVRLFREGKREKAMSAFADWNFGDKCAFRDPDHDLFDLMDAFDAGQLDVKECVAIAKKLSLGLADNDVFWKCLLSNLLCEQTSTEHLRIGSIFGPNSGGGKKKKKKVGGSPSFAGKDRTFASGSSSSNETGPVETGFASSGGDFSLPGGGGGIFGSSPIGGIFGRGDIFGPSPSGGNAFGSNGSGGGGIFPPSSGEGSILGPHGSGGGSIFGPGSGSGGSIFGPNGSGGESIFAPGSGSGGSSFGPTGSGGRSVSGPSSGGGGGVSGPGAGSIFGPRLGGGAGIFGSSSNGGTAAFPFANLPRISLDPTAGTSPEGVADTLRAVDETDDFFDPFREDRDDEDNADDSDQIIEQFNTVTLN